MMHKASIVSWGMITLRLVVGLNLALTGGLLGFIYGGGELIVVCMGILNEWGHKDRDRRSYGDLVAVCYMSGYVLLPEIQSFHLVLPWILAGIGIAQIYVRLVLGRRTSLGGSTWIDLCDEWPYSAIRHPQIALCILSRWVFVWGCWTPWNVTSSIIFTLALLWSIALEESFLMRREEYRAYCRRVRFRFVPGLI